MDLIPLRGGTGNQLFNFSLGVALRSNGRPVVWDTSLMDQRRVLAIDGLIQNDRKTRLGYKALRGILKLDQRGLLGSSRVIREADDMRYDERIFSNGAPRHRVILGYWQSRRYFEQVQTLLQNALAQWLDAVAEEAPMPSGDYVAVHVRRGDYVTDPAASRVIGALDPSYQRSAMDKYRRMGYRRFVLFSDDPAWSWQVLGAPDVEVAPEVENDLVHLRAMSRSAAIVIANSSFSWWAGWLVSRGGGDVIAPERWFRDPRLRAVNPALPEWLGV